MPMLMPVAANSFRRSSGGWVLGSASVLTPVLVYLVPEKKKDGAGAETGEGAKSE